MQKFRVAANDEEAAKIPGDFPCSEYVIKAQVLAGGRGKGHFDNGFKGGVHLTKDPSKVAELCTAMIGHKYVVRLLPSLYNSQYFQADHQADSTRRGAGQQGDGG